MKKLIYNFLAKFIDTPFWLPLLKRFLLWGEQGYLTVDPVERQFPIPIGIWQPEFRNGEIVFIRPEQQVFGDHYSDVQTFKLNKAPNTKRICYFGESAALGYLYAPHFSPSGYLEDILNHHETGQDFEVIDLSMTNETLESMLEKFQAAMQLKPDSCVIFAGNNWPLLETPDLSPYAKDVFARNQIGKLLSKGGRELLADFTVKRRLYKIGQVFSEIDRIARRQNVRMVVVIPEVNLADWESRQPVPFLPDQQVNQWYGKYRQALELIQKEEWERVKEIAFEMWDFDHGSCPTTYRLLAIAFRNLGDAEKWRSACHAEVDSVMLPFTVFLNAPQIASYDQAILRKTASLYGYDLVDLPEIFAQYSPNGVPGRELFFDYCHLTKAGIEVVIKEIAALFLETYFEGSKEVQLELPPPKIRPEHQALAEFGAAIHTAHRLVPVSNKSEILTYWCDKAYQTSPAIAKTMLDFVKARTALVPAVLTDAQQRILKSDYVILHSHGWEYEGLDIEMILAIQEVLKQVFPDVCDQVSSLLVEKHAVERHNYDLAASSKYLWNPLEQTYTDLLHDERFNQRALLRSFWPEMDFILISEASGDLQVELSSRALFADSSAKMKLRVNGNIVGENMTSAVMQRVRFLIPQATLRKGVNCLSIIWPELAPDTSGLDQAVKRLRRGQSADLTPVFGEIYSLKFWPDESTSQRS